MKRLLFFVLTFVVFFASTYTAHAATLSLPERDPYIVGETFTLPVYVSSADGESANAISATLTYPHDLLQVLSLTKTGIINFWVQEPDFSNTTGIIRLQGVVYNPAFTGQNGQVIAARFKVLAPGTATISFQSPSVLANDGQGTDILTGAVGTTILLNKITRTEDTPPVRAAPLDNLLANVTSSTHPDQSLWYHLSHVVLDWTNTPRVSAVRLGYDRNADGVPTVLYTEPISHKELQLEDGIWYFHVQERGPSGWGSVSTFRIQIDTVPPLPINLQFPNGMTTASTTIAAKFDTTDTLSGIDHYTLSIDGNILTVSAENGAHIYTLPPQDTGIHALTVTAFDKAGNVTSTSGEFNVVGVTIDHPPMWFSTAWIAINYFSISLIILALLLLLAFVVWYLWHHFHSYRRRLAHRLDHTQSLVHRQFATMKEMVNEEIDAFNNIKTKRALSVEEKRFMNRLKKIIEQSEEVIEEDIDNAKG